MFSHREVHSWKPLLMAALAMAVISTLRIDLAQAASASEINSKVNTTLTKLYRTHPEQKRWQAKRRASWFSRILSRVDLSSPDNLAMVLCAKRAGRWPTIARSLLLLVSRRARSRLAMFCFLWTMIHLRISIKATAGRLEPGQPW